MTAIAIIQRYDPNKASGVDHEICLPTHVTITGKEDHFSLAYNDARMIIAGMRLRDEKPSDDEADIIYRIKSIVL